MATPKEEYLLKLEILQTIEGDRLKTPNNIPVESYIQDAEILYKEAVKDETVLLSRGLAPDLLTDIPARIGALRHAEAEWSTMRFDRDESAEQWAEESPAAYDLRDELIHHFRFAFRNEPRLLGKVKSITEGHSHADMIQDLAELNVLGHQTSELLAAINFDTLLLDQAAEKANALGEMYAEVMEERREKRELKLARDQAFTYLKEGVDEVMAFGQYVFWKDEKRRSKYSSLYLQQKRTRQTPKDEDNTAGDGDNAGDGNNDGDTTPEAA